MRPLRYVLFIILIATATRLALAEPAPEASPKGRSRPVKRGKRIRENETEGTQAPNRFEGEPVIKSKYELNGQPLEVDPD